MKQPIVIAVLMLLLAVPCVAQDLVRLNVDEYVKAEMQRQQIPELSLAVLNHGRIILTIS
ncbi:MAG: hypothetical protein ACR2G5_15080 [Pyrinomonadaceae bacterium]